MSNQPPNTPRGNPNFLMGIYYQLLLTWRLLFDKRVPIWAKLPIVLAALYLISPIDFIPDFIVGLGQLDDLGLILAGMKLTEQLAPADVVEEHRTEMRLRAGGSGETTTKDGKTTIGNARYRVVDEKPKRR